MWVQKNYKNSKEENKSTEKEHAKTFGGTLEGTFGGTFEGTNSFLTYRRSGWTSSRRWMSWDRWENCQKRVCICKNSSKLVKWKKGIRRKSLKKNGQNKQMSLLCQREIFLNACVAVCFFPIWLAMRSKPLEIMKDGEPVGVNIDFCVRFSLPGPFRPTTRRRKSYRP